MSSGFTDHAYAIVQFESWDFLTTLLQIVVTHLRKVHIETMRVVLQITAVTIYVAHFLCQYLLYHFCPFVNLKLLFDQKHMRKLVLQCLQQDLRSLALIQLCVHV